MPVPLFSSFKIVHFHVHQALNWNYCQKTFETVNTLREKYGIESRSLALVDVYAYWEAVKEVWGKANLVTIEQDIIFTEDQLLELLKCKQKDCAFAYKLHPVTTALPYLVWNFGDNLLPYRIRLCLIEETPKFASFASLGFAKVSKETQARVEMDTPTHWRFVDLATIGRVKGLNIHIHYEVEHAHR